MTASASILRTVAKEHTAARVGSGDLLVLGTPILIAWLEAATLEAMQLEPGQSSVGTRIEVDHLAASAIGETITATAVITEVDGRRVRFEVTATDLHGTMVASGHIHRAVVEKERFLSRVPRVAELGVEEFRGGPHG